MKNPAYVQADLEVYEFFKNQDSVVTNEVADFAGIDGCYLFQGRDAKDLKRSAFKTSDL